MTMCPVEVVRTAIVGFVPAPRDTPVPDTLEPVPVNVMLPAPSLWMVDWSRTYTPMPPAVSPTVPVSVIAPPLAVTDTDSLRNTPCACDVPLAPAVPSMRMLPEVVVMPLPPLSTRTPSAAAAEAAPWPRIVTFPAPAEMLALLRRTPTLAVTEVPIAEPAALAFPPMSTLPPAVAILARVPPPPTCTPPPALVPWSVSALSVTSSAPPVERMFDPLSISTFRAERKLAVFAPPPE